jgi:hypothetical protein
MTIRLVWWGTSRKTGGGGDRDIPERFLLKGRRAVRKLGERVRTRGLLESLVELRERRMEDRRATGAGDIELSPLHPLALNCALPPLNLRLESNLILYLPDY